MAPKQKPGRSKQDYETPWDFVFKVADTFGFESFHYDLAASHENAKALAFIDEEEDSLKVSWHDLPGTNFWLNPPFGNIEPWVSKACIDMGVVGEWTNTRRLFVLLPASVGSLWYAKWVEGMALVLALRPRLTFAGEKDPYPKDLILAVYGPWPGFHTWDWKEGRGD